MENNMAKDKDSSIIDALLNHLINKADEDELNEMNETEDDKNEDLNAEDYGDHEDDEDDEDIFAKRTK